MPVQHLACIMDGNRRYAKQYGWHPWIGHEKGIQAVQTAIDFCLQHNISYLSLYTFSLENFKRSAQEKDFLFALIVASAKKHLNQALQKGIKIRFVGDRSLFPHSVVPTCDQVEQATAHCSNLHVNFLFCYGGQQELVHVTKEIARKVAIGQLDPAQINEQLITEHLWTGDIPEPDLIIRTGGQQRVSNFLLFQSAYSEYCFIDQYWPALTVHDFQKAYDQFVNRKRNYGV